MIYWICVCGHSIPEIAYLNHKYDYGCPKCGKSFFSFSRKGRKEMTKVLILNAPAESGKGEVAKFIGKHLPFEVLEYSSINYVKEIAKEKFEWDGVKNVKGRNLLSALKQAMIAYNDLPTKMVISVIKECELFDYGLLIVDIREPDEIDKIVNYCKEKGIICHTCRIKNSKAEEKAEKSGLSTTGDLMYGRYDYDIYIYNEGTLEELEKHTKELFTNIYVENIDVEKSDKIVAPGSHERELPIKNHKYNYCVICNHGKLKEQIRTKSKRCNFCGQEYSIF